MTTPINADAAPRTTTWGERLVFAQAYETLVRVDCHGRPTPALAKRWTSVEGSARWTLFLRDTARFWNGDRLTAPAVITSWRASAAPIARRFAEGATAVDDSTLDISVPGAALVTLGDPDLAIARRVASSRWPEGTGPYRIRDGSSSGRPSTIVLEPGPAAGLPRLTIRSASEADARDLIDGGTDLLVTDAPALATYAATRSDVTAMPLGWNRTWVLIVPRATPLAPVFTSDTAHARAIAFRSELARDVVRADARASEGPNWWNSAATCGFSAPIDRPVESVPGTRIVYPADEPVARAIAERLVALSGTRATSSGLTPNALASALATGAEAAYVLPLPRVSLGACHGLNELLSSAPWLAGSTDVHSSIVPLVDTRLRVVARRDRLNLTLTWDSTLTVSRPTPVTISRP